MADKLTKFRALSRVDQMILIMAIFLLPLWQIGLRLTSGLRLERGVRSRDALKCLDGSIDQAMTTGRLVNLAARLTIGHPSCLVRSLFLRWLLERRGLPCVLKIGVRLIDGNLDAHAWIESGGMPVNEAPAVVACYSAFDESISARDFPALL
jgi:hypothetical protein